MVDTSMTSNVDRRSFLNGKWNTPAAVEANSIPTEIASVLVQTRPERLEAAVCAIAALPDVQIFSHDPRGKLVVVIESSDVGRIGTMLNTISLMPNVLTATLVFHATDAA
jgi:nitrate reductase NapD